MDYSLLLGLHDCTRAEEERNLDQDEGDAGLDDDEDSSGSGVERWGRGEGAGGITTPPDSPRTLVREASMHDGCIIPELDIYAIPSLESKSLHYILQSEIHLSFK
jgi:1-phosphatidylinositol-5-phosphate 4-kinase